MKHTDDVDDGRGDGVLAATRSVNERRLEQLRRTRVTGALDTAEVVALIHSIRDRKGVDRRRRRGARNRPAESRLNALVLDAGALVAVDRGDRSMMARLRVAQQQGIALRTSAIVIAQVWRDPAGRQARLARLLRALDVVPSMSNWAATPVSFSPGPARMIRSTRSSRSSPHLATVS